VAEVEVAGVVRYCGLQVYEQQLARGRLDVEASDELFAIGLAWAETPVVG
jgi:hypothetical protein